MPEWALTVLQGFFVVLTLGGVALISPYAAIALVGLLGLALCEAAARR